MASPPAIPTRRPMPPPKPPKPTKPAKPTHLAKASSSASSQASTRTKPSVVVATPSTANTAKTSSSRPSARPESRKYGYTIWAHNIAYGNVFFLLVFGTFSLYWTAQGFDSDSATQELLLVTTSETLSNVAGYYAIGMSFPIGMYEYAFGLTHGNEPSIDGHPIPLKGIFYLVASVPLFFSYPTMMPGVTMVLNGGAYIAATMRGERVNPGTVKPASYCLCSRESHHKKETDEQAKSSGGITAWLRSQKEMGRLSQVILITIYGIINVFLWTQSFLWWQGYFAGLGRDVPYAPYAKAFGQLLNFNCAIILFPILRSLLKRLNNFQITPTKSFASFLPLRKNIVFHKIFATMVFVAVVGHVGFHFLNYGVNAYITNAAFSKYPWGSGYVITIAMFIIFSGAQARVKRAHYEIFWLSHHWFIVFFAFLLCHGAKFWIWASLPILLYCLERVMRSTRGTKPFYLKAVTYTKPVICIEFFPKDLKDFEFREGQYLYLMVPALSKNEWHPFTISSAHGDLVQEPGRVTLHIRVQGPGSWTARLRDFFQSMTPRNAITADSYELELSHIDANGRRQPGKHLGPDGQPLICVDGPHAAPAQHYSEYNEVMLIGAGIGLTPAAAIIQAILKHKWKKGFLPETIYFYWVVRHSEIASFQWFINLLTSLQKMVASDRVAGSLSGNHRLEINIFVTSAPKSRVDSPSKAGLVGASSRDLRDSGRACSIVQAGFNVDIGFDEQVLTDNIMNPTVSPKQYSNVISSLSSSSNPVPQNKLEDIFIWNGRPNWSDIFYSVKARKREQTSEIGVCFCGAAVIGKDLKRNCVDYSSVNENFMFALHKENF